MRAGLFGKLPAKRDFVALAAPRAFLTVWERWLQGGVSASRQELGPAWQDAFLRAPIWRFWLGAEISGAPVVGAFMPSVDGVGRYFPLSVFAAAEEGDVLPPPELAPQEDWFAAAEEVLLGALDTEARYEDVVAALGGLPFPSVALAPPEGTSRLPRGPMMSTAGGAAGFAAARIADHARFYGAATYWWTIGGEGFAPALLAEHRMPDPYLFTAMLTGRFAPASAAPVAAG
ncbi:MAG TPA: type VI secretion system-associated protein TagF [Hyphomicrobiales bacterium]|nr:type VI secretion system-associated protein TagF [Hyphomicrobiales bacterium]